MRFRDRDITAYTLLAFGVKDVLDNLFSIPTYSIRIVIVATLINITIVYSAGRLWDRVRGRWKWLASRCRIR